MRRLVTLLAMRKASRCYVLEFRKAGQMSFSCLRVFSSQIDCLIHHICCFVWGFALTAVLDVSAYAASDSLLSAFKASAPKTLLIRRALDPIVVDAYLNERTWQEAAVATDFVQNFPFDSSLAQAQTKVRVTYDDRALYVAAICYDHSPANFVMQSLRRDFEYELNDNFTVIIDPLSNQTTGFVFSVSPLGVQREGLISGGGFFGASNNWDNAWQAEARLDSGQWIVEMAIPFNTLRFKSGVSSWRINFARNNLKLPENSSWAPVPRFFQVTNLAFAGELRWDTPPENRSTNISLIPYTIGTTSANYQTQTFSTLSLNFGGDAKLALTSALNLDLTFNPDFSQVDVDRQITNLDRFTIFFPEQRQFFLENSDLFSTLGFSRIRPFFSRQIGLFNGQPTSIIAGARLSGNLDANWRIGALVLQTARNDSLRYNGNNYSVAVAQRLLFERSSLTIFGVNRQGNAYRGIAGNDFNRVFGIDFNLGTNDGRWIGRLFYHHNFTPQSLPHQYATALFLRYEQPEFRLEWNHEFIGEHYNPEVGFVPRRGVWRFEPQASYRFYPKSDFINNHGVFLRLDMYRSQNFTTELDRLIYLEYFFNLQNTGKFGAYFNDILTNLTFPFDPTGRNEPDNQLPLGNYVYQLYGGYFATDPRERFSFSGTLETGGYFSGRRTRYVLSPRYRAQPYGLISIDFEQNFIFLPSPFRSATLTLLNLRLDLSLTKELFITTFLQYNTQIQNVNLNMRLQWRFAPMSDVFLVYTDNYNTETLGIRNRGFVLKLSYWLNV